MRLAKNKSRRVEMKFEALVELSREAEDKATSRRLWRIPPPAGAEGFQIAGLTLPELSAKEYRIKSIGLK